MFPLILSEQLSTSTGGYAPNNTVDSFAAGSANMDFRPRKVLQVRERCGLRRSLPRPQGHADRRRSGALCQMREVSDGGGRDSAPTFGDDSQSHQGIASDSVVAASETVGKEARER